MIKDNTEAVLGVMEQKVWDKLEVAGEVIESKAVAGCPVDTGFMKGTHGHYLSKDLSLIGMASEKEQSVIIGVNASYAPYVEGRFKPWLQNALRRSLGQIRRLFAL